jgi:hypothetical protein
MIKFIFVLYCEMGCELSHPNHRINSAYATVEGCQHAKEVAESGGTIFSCERIAFYQW